MILNQVSPPGGVQQGLDIHDPKPSKSTRWCTAGSVDTNTSEGRCYLRDGETGRSGAAVEGEVEVSDIATETGIM